MKTRKEIKNIAREAIHYMTRSEANKIFYEIVEVDKMEKKYGNREEETYRKKKRRILLKIRTKACRYDIKEHPEDRGEFDKYMKNWLLKIY